MTKARISPLPTDRAQALWNGGKDDYGMAPERHVSDGSGIPCRHCLELVPEGEAFLALGYRPFPEQQPYAETGPIFIHAEPCRAYADVDRLPRMHVDGEARIVRGYGPDNRIVYGTGKIVDPADILPYAGGLLERDDIAYVHVRSSENNCFTFRVDRD